MQRTSLAISSLFHVGVIAVSYYGLPALRDNTPLVDTPIIVELVNVAEITNVAPKPKPKAKPAPPKAKPPPPPPKAAETPPPPPPPEPEVKEEVAALPPVPEPKAKPKPKPKPKVDVKPKPKPKVKIKPKAPTKLAKIKPRQKPKPPDAFASVLKTLAELESTAPAKKKKEKKPAPKKDAFELEIAKALASKANTFDASRPVSISEIDLVRQQITQCWSVPAGAKDAQNLVIDIAVKMNRDGTVQHAELRKGSGSMSDPFYRTAAESALRAVLNPKCQPFKLPAKKFDRWKTMTLSFNPSDIL
jgi:hypothetical protein